jgi:beta-lactamase regulating signal transducer with metallopeptidase domain
MNGIPTFVYAVASAAISSLFASIWQGAVLVSGVAIALRLIPGLTASVRSAIWSAVLLLVAGLPFVFWLWPHTDAHPAQAHAAIQLSTTLALALAGFWLALTVFRLVQLAISALHLQSLLKRSVPLVTTAKMTLLLRHGKSRVQLCTSLDVDRPCIAGFRHPRILLPTLSIWAEDSTDLEQIVLHEMEHLRRRDDWVNLLQKLALAFFPLHPVLTWLDHRLCSERELACDDNVLRRTRAPKAYAECLARLAESRLVQRGVSLVLGALGPLGRQPELVRRVQRILSAPPVRMGRYRVIVVTASLLLGIGTGAALLARSPSLIAFEAVDVQPQVIQAGVQTFPQENAGAARALMVSTHTPLAATQSGTLGTAVFRLNPGMARKTGASRKLSHQPSWITGRRLKYRDLTFGLTFAKFSTDSPSTYAFIATRDGWLLVQL